VARQAEAVAFTRLRSARSEFLASLIRLTRSIINEADAFELMTEPTVCLINRSATSVQFIRLMFMYGAPLRTQSINARERGRERARERGSENTFLNYIKYILYYISCICLFCFAVHSKKLNHFGLFKSMSNMEPLVYIFNRWFD